MKPYGETHSMRLLVADKPGVLVRVVLVFSRRGYNVATLALAPASPAGLSDIALSFQGNKESLPGIKQQLKKQVDVIEVEITGSVR
jgi:acetolactate synthase I/III small subunit